VNRLLVPVLDAACTALGMLVDTGGAPLPPALRLAGWAGLVVEVFRSQPALVAAGIQARAIQHELVQAWQLPLAAGLDDLPLTRCEIAPGHARTAGETRPRTLDVADLTFTALRLDRELLADIDDTVTDDTDDGGPPGLARQLRHDESVDLLLRRLLAAGTAADASYLWMSERAPGQLAVEALLPTTDVVDRFVRHSQRLLGHVGVDSVGSTEPPHVLPAVPDARELAALPVLDRRAVLIALLTVLRHIQHSPRGRDATRREIVPVLAAIADRADRILPADDPVAVLTACRVADMTVQTLRPDLREDLRGPLADLLTGLDRCEDLLRRGLLDRGAAAEAISSACVELNAVARTNAGRAGSGLPSPQELTERLRRSWGTFHQALEIAPFSAGVEVPRPPGLAGYHLQNYAAFLAGSAAEDELEEAVALFAEVVIPAREEFFARSAHFVPLRNALQVASRATTRLAERARDRGDHVAALRWAARGRSWVCRALAAEETRRLVAATQPTESACRFALLAAPALLLAAEVGVAGAGADVAQAAELVELARRWESAQVGDAAQHARNPEVVALAARLRALAG
jgi:hypothetical protein